MVERDRISPAQEITVFVAIDEVLDRGDLSIDGWVYIAIPNSKIPLKWEYKRIVEFSVDPRYY